MTYNIVMTDEQRTCKTCGLTGPLSWFAKAARSKRNGAQWYRHDCRACRTKYLATRQEERGLELPTEAPEKQCIKCEALKPTAEFSLMDKGSRRGNECAECRGAYQKQYRKENLSRMQEYHAMRRAADPNYARRTNLKSYFKLTLAEWEALFEAQGRVCAVCGTDEPGNKNWHTDHDHACCPGRRSCGGCVRGVICRDCNLTLGQVNDNPVRLQAMIDYLATHSRPNLKAV